MKLHHGPMVQADGVDATFSRPRLSGRRWAPLTTLNFQPSLSAVCGLDNLPSLADATGFSTSSYYVFGSEFLVEPNEKGPFIALIGFTRYFESFQ